MNKRMVKRMNKLLLGCVTLSLSFSCFAAEQASDSEQNKKTKPVQEAPKVKKGFVPRAEITIVEKKDSILKEYHIAGALRAIKVTPKNGLPVYYLIDRKGTGEFIKIGPDMGDQVDVPNWIFFEW